jgi:hypothetical protein
MDTHQDFPDWVFDRSSMSPQHGLHLTVFDWRIDNHDEDDTVGEDAEEGVSEYAEIQAKDYDDLENEANDIDDPYEDLDELVPPEVVDAESSVSEEERNMVNLLVSLGLGLEDFTTEVQAPRTETFGPEMEVENSHRVAYSKITRSECYEGAALIIGTGLTFLDKFATDQHANTRETTGNLYYPMSSYKEWEFTNLLLRLLISLSWKNRLLQTQIVSSLLSSFKVRI